MSDPFYDSASDEISLRPYIEALGRYKRVIGLAVLASIVVFALGLMGAYLLLPKERLAIIGFRLLFNGADQSQYPNGTPFNPTEIVASPVLASVYETNDLKPYLTLSTLQESMFVLHSSRVMQELDRAYLARLSDTKLAPMERARLEDEYNEKREALRDPEYTVTLRLAARLTEMPRELQEQILVDTLRTWAIQADTQKGAARPDVDVFSQDVFARAANQDETFLVRIDVLRTGTQRLIGALESLQEIPGARAARTDDNRSIADELAGLEDILKFDIEPLMGLARVGGRDSEDRLVLMAYISNQLVTYRLNLRTAQARAQNLQTSLREYMAQRGGRVPATQPAADGTEAANPVTALGDSFIDRLLEMSAAAQAPEAEYRRDLTNKFIEASDEAAAAEREIGYYEDLLRQLSAPATPLSGRFGKELMDARFDRVLAALKESLGRIQRLYEVVSVQTLNPTRQMYSITQPFRVQATTVIPPRTVAIAFVGLIMLTLVGAIIGCLIHAHQRSLIPRPKARDSAPALTI
jgi:hypothetical protein